VGVATYFSQLKMKIIDWLAVKCADIVLVETFAQKKFFEQRFFWGEKDKYKVVYTGVDDSIFYFDDTVVKLPYLLCYLEGD